MNPGILITNGLWAGLFAACFGILLTAPPRVGFNAFLCGFVARAGRDLFTNLGLSPNWSTVIAAALVVILAVALVRGKDVSPVVLITGILPLGATGAMFQAIVALMKVSSVEGEELDRAAMALSVNAGKVFTTTLAIALGIGVGMAICRLLQSGFGARRGAPGQDFGNPAG